MINRKDESTIRIHLPKHIKNKGRLTIMYKDKEVFAKELYEFMKSNDSLGELAEMPAEDAIAELKEYLSDPESVKDTLRDIEEIADEMDDHEVYVSEIKPMVKSLESLLETLEAEKNRRMVADTGYEVKHALHIGDREILIAVNMQEPDGKYYMKAEYTENGIIGQYDRIIYTSDYLAVMEEFTGALHQKVTALRDEFSKADYQAAPITAADCYPHDYAEDLNGKVVAIKADVLRPEYQRGDVQMVLVDGGNGARGNARGNAVFCYHLNDGHHTRFERYDVLGVVKELPDWAKERVTAIQAEREAARQPKPAAPEIVAGYEILERVSVGDKTFVMGHNREADSYATWQHTQGRDGYDLGHYYQSREKAVRDLNARADKERNGQAPDKTKRHRDDAR
jgi:hypothetical protein